MKLEGEKRKFEDDREQHPLAPQSFNLPLTLRNTPALVTLATLLYLPEWVP